MNQYVAQAADEVILMVSGIPVMVKETRRQGVQGVQGVQDK
jgi:hypothetical protein